MKYIEDRDYEYIKSKYPKKRFTRKDEVFSQDSGMAPEDIMAGITENDALLAEMPHPVRKASQSVKAFP